MYGKLGFIQFDPSVRALLDAGAELDEQSLCLIKRFWSIPMCLKALVAALVRWYFNSTMLAEAIKIPLAAR
jgi:hypothetical protein